MIGYIILGTNDLECAAVFYDAILALLGLVRVERAETFAA